MATNDSLDGTSSFWNAEPHQINREAILMRVSKQSGFSLVELMIVVAIMAILAAIAIPSFLKFQTKAKESEARNNLAAIRTCEESYRAEEDRYHPCLASPDSIPVADSVTWVDVGTPATPGDPASGNCFEDIGFEPSGKVRFQYAVTMMDVNRTSYEATAEGNLTGDEVVTFTMSNDNPKPERSTSAPDAGGG